MYAPKMDAFMSTPYELQHLFFIVQSFIGNVRIISIGAQDISSDLSAFVEL